MKKNTIQTVLKRGNTKDVHELENIIDNIVLSEQIGWINQEQVIVLNKMIADLIEHHLHKGMTYKSMIEMLGDHENYSDLDSNTIGYEVYVDYGLDIDPVETKTLLIEFSQDSIITDFRLLHWKK